MRRNYLRIRTVVTVYYVSPYYRRTASTGIVADIHIVGTGNHRCFRVFNGDAESTGSAVAGCIGDAVSHFGCAERESITGVMATGYGCRAIIGAGRSRPFNYRFTYTRIVAHGHIAGAIFQNRCNIIFYRYNGGTSTFVTRIIRSGENNRIRTQIVTTEGRYINAQVNSFGAVVIAVVVNLTYGNGSRTARIQFNRQVVAERSRSLSVGNSYTESTACRITRRIRYGVSIFCSTEREIRTACQAFV